MREYVKIILTYTAVLFISCQSIAAEVHSNEFTGNKSQKNSIELVHLSNEKLSFELESIELNQAMQIFNILSDDHAHAILVANNIASNDINLNYENLPLNVIFKDVLVNNDIGFKVIGDSFIFLYEKNEFNECVMDNVYENFITQNNSKFYPKSLARFSIMAQDLDLYHYINLIYKETGVNFYIDNNYYLFNKGGERSLKETVYVDNVDLSEMLTYFSVITDIRYEFIDNNNVLIEINPHKIYCSKYED